MAQIGSGYMVSDILSFGFPDQQSQTYFQNNFNALQNMNLGFSQGFVDGAKELISNLSVNNLIDKAKEVVGKIGRYLRTDVIRRCDNVLDLQCATPINIRYNMAEPTALEKYREGRIKGYGEDYEDLHPDLIGETHPDYRRVMTGMVLFDEEKTYCNKYYQELDKVNGEMEEPLSSTEQFTILNNWDLLLRAIHEEHHDPTCPFGSFM